MKELDQFTVEQLEKYTKLEALTFPPSHAQVASLARIALSVKLNSDPHKRMEVWHGGNTWIQCSKQAYDRAEAAGGRVRILYERPVLNSPETPDGWVACSERMPENNDQVLTWNGQYKTTDLFLSGSFLCNKPNLITHWMPLPAAPKPEK